MQAANVLVNTDGRVVLSDFGVTANMLEPRTSTPKAASSTLTLREISSVKDLSQLAGKELESAPAQPHTDAGVAESSPQPDVSPFAGFDCPGIGLASGGAARSSEEEGSGGGQFRSAWACQKYLARNTFTGTPCFMAPEVMAATDDCQQSSGWANISPYSLSNCSLLCAIMLACLNQGLHSCCCAGL